MKNVVSVIEETEVTWEMADGRVNVRIPQLTVWDMIQIEME